MKIINKPKINLLNNIDDQDIFDSDADGLLDEEEIALGTDPDNPDTDNDGLNDYEEIYVYHTDPLDPDTDHDGILDGDEVRLGYNPRGPGRLKDFFIASHKNNFRPHALHPGRIAFYILAILSMKLVVVVSLVSFPIDAWLTQDIAYEQGKKIIALTNQIRSKLGLTALSESTTLNQAAVSKAQDMIDNQYFAHVSPQNRGLAYWLSMAKYVYFTAGENLAMGFNDAPDVVNAWTQSKTHYANLIDGDFTQIGVGMVAGEYKGYDTTFVAQMFGKPKAQIQPQATTASKPAPEPVTNQRTTVSAPPPTTTPKAPATAATPKPVVQSTAITQPKNSAAATPKPAAQPDKAPVAAPKPLPEPAIISPQDSSLSNKSELIIKVFAPEAQSIIIYDNSKMLATATSGASQFFEIAAFLESGQHILKATAIRGKDNSTSKDITVAIDSSPPHIDLANSKIEIIDEDDDHQIIAVNAMLSADTVRAEASFNNYSIELKPDDSSLNKWTGQTVIFKENGENPLNPVVLASITATDRAGSTVTQDIMWENIKPLKKSLLNQYLYLKNNQSTYSKWLFDISNTFYKFLLILAMAVLGINIFNQLHKRQPHILLSTVGLIGLLVVLIIV